MAWPEIEHELERSNPDDQQFELLRHQKTVSSACVSGFFFEFLYKIFSGKHKSQMIPSSVLLRCVRRFKPDVSELPISSIFKGQANSLTRSKAVCKRLPISSNFKDQAVNKTEESVQPWQKPNNSYNTNHFSRGKRSYLLHSQALQPMQGRGRLK
jgi:hypothetical protein